VSGQTKGQWIVTVSDGDPIPDAEVVKVLGSEERAVFGTTQSKTYRILLLRDSTHHIRHTTVMPLDNYEASNLKEGLLTLRKLGLDTGDWLGQLLFKLDKYEITHKPNQTVEQQYDRAVATIVSRGIEVT
jgi:hypothetical protein